MMSGWGAPSLGGKGCAGGSWAADKPSADRPCNGSQVCGLLAGPRALLREEGVHVQQPLGWCAAGPCVSAAGACCFARLSPGTVA